MEFEDLDNVKDRPHCRRCFVAVYLDDDPPSERGEIMDKLLIDVREIAFSKEKTGYTGINFEARDDKNETGESQDRCQCCHPARATP
jgi:hypothetical protein